MVANTGVMGLKGWALSFVLASSILAPATALADTVSCEGNIANGKSEVKCTSPDAAGHVCQFSWKLVNADNAQFDWAGQFTVVKGDNRTVKASIAAYNAKPISGSASSAKISCK